jgi:NAD(P)-dependent dehydrogenase (short-subunit alcohol dehydrogenase family)
MNNGNERTVLITGGARRLGAAIAEHMAAKGWNVVVHCNHSQKEARKLCRKLEKVYGIKTFVICGDFSEINQVDLAFKSAVESAGRIDTLINNASIFSVQPADASVPEEYARFNQINAIAPIHLTKLFAKHIRKRRSSGSVINILDQRINNSQASATPYLLSKRALAAFTITAASELAPQIRVNAIAPGAIIPPENADGKEPAGKILLRTAPTPQDVTQALAYLLAAESVTGQTLFIDSGQHLI